MKQMILNEGWKFRKASEEVFHDVRLPHDAMREEPRDPNCPSGAATGFYPGGQYVYEKELSIPDAWRGKAVWLRFEGIYEYGRIFVNDQPAGKSDNGYLDFTLRIDPFLKFGEKNLLRVEADNPGQNSRWYTGSGLYRPVTLIVKEPVHIVPDGIRVHTVSVDPAVIRVSVTAENDTDGAAHLPLRITLQGAAAEEAITIPAHGTLEKTVTLQVPDAKLWFHEHPYLTDCAVTLGEDSETVRFGIRTAEVVNGKGLLVNGQPVKLLGACLHHDNGMLGAATHKEAEYRRVKALKELGYNAIRSAHNPISRAMLAACDELGMYVMDELYDMWLIHKNPNDYADRTEKNHVRDIRSMVRKDFNHPCVIMYSIGNEISETAKPDGVAFAKKLYETVKAEDPTRPVTTNMNFKLNCLLSMGMGVYKNPKKQQESDPQKPKKEKKSLTGSAFVNYLSEKISFLMEKLTATKRADRKTKDTFALLDIAGYSYGQGRYAKDLKQYPDRIIVGSETYVTDLPESWIMMRENPNLIGDFVWTGWDYLGEAGIGSWDYASDATGDTGYFKPYPWKLGVSGMVDITGQPTVSGRYAETILKQLTRPFVAVSQPNHYREKHSRSSWNFTNALPSWSYPGYDGTPVTVEVYSAAPQVEVFVNGRSLGRNPAGASARYRTLYQTAYESGELKAVSYTAAGEKIGENVLRTANDAQVLALRPSIETAKENGLVFVDISLCDDQGVLKVMESGKIAVEVEGGKLLALGSVKACTTEEYTQSECALFHGRAQAILQASDAASVILRAVYDGKAKASAEISTGRQPE